MLVSQAKVACEYFLNKKIDDSVMDAVYKDILSSKQNTSLFFAFFFYKIVLI